MPKVAKELSAIEVKRLKKPGLHAVGGVAGLLLQVTPSGATSWILRTVIGEKRRDIGLGGYPEVSLSNARDNAREAKGLILKGIDPIEQRKANKSLLIASQVKGMTFDDAALIVHNKKASELKSEKYAAQWLSVLNNYASPVIGKMLLADIKLEHIKQILDPIWKEKTETAKKLRGNIEKVLAWGAVMNLRPAENPARWKGFLEVIYPAPNEINGKKHHPALPVDRINEFAIELRKREGIAARALEFAILTAARSGEVRGATWDEIDIPNRLWVIPANRMKADNEHRVPLSDDSINLLNALPRLAGNPLVFPAPRGNVMSDMSLAAVIKRMNEDNKKNNLPLWLESKTNREIVPHGFRATFRVWAGERTNFPREVAEMALAHIIQGVEGDYMRGDLIEKRTKLMHEWAKFINSPPTSGKVIPIKKSKNAA